MEEDDELCLCFHVTRRKVVQYIRVNRPVVPSQLSECYGAGTGCGWCRPFLRRLMEEDDPETAMLPDSKSYLANRHHYRKKAFAVVTLDVNFRFSLCSSTLFGSERLPFSRPGDLCRLVDHLGSSKPQSLVQPNRGGVIRCDFQVHF